MNTALMHITDAQLCELVNIFAAFSPENLSSDGEAPLATISSRLADLTARRAKLESEIGFAVSETDVWREWERRCKANPQLRNE